MASTPRLQRTRATGGADPRGRPPGWRLFARNRLALSGATYLVVLALACALAPLLTSQSPTAMTLARPYAPPNREHVMGTDALGRDVWSRVLFGGRFDLGLSVAAVTIATSAGVLLGLVAGYWGGAVENVLMRGIDILLAIPDLLLALAIVAFVGPSIPSVVLVIAFTRMPRYARLVRGAVLGLKGREFVTAATALGASRARILLRHLIPNLTGVIVVYSTLDLGGALGALAGLSFVGVGIQPPSPEWGLMLADARQNLVLAPWSAIFPGLTISLTILAFNFTGDGLRDTFDPRLGRRRG
ncbi:MAG: ABC transporter permease [Armatimonadota bacterium]|nr:ABC transporter permease [Armatimonadota bacterium]